MFTHFEYGIIAVKVKLHKNFSLSIGKTWHLLGAVFSFITVFENRPKSRIKHCERSELRFSFWVDKSSLEMPKMIIVASFWKLKQCYQTGHFFIGHKIVENTKIKKVKCDILGDFQTLCAFSGNGMQSIFLARSRSEWKFQSC